MQSEVKIYLNNSKKLINLTALFVIKTRWHFCVFVLNRFEYTYNAQFTRSIVLPHITLPNITIIISDQENLLFTKT